MKYKLTISSICVERERENLYSTRKGVLWFNSISNREWGERYLISHHSGDVL